MSERCKQCGDAIPERIGLRECLLKCSQCGVEKAESQVHFLYRDLSIKVCRDCAKLNVSGKLSIDLVLLEMNYQTAAKFNERADRALFLLLDKYKAELPYLDFEEANVDAAVLQFIKAFRQVDVVDGTIDMVIWNLLNATNRFEKSVARVKAHKSRFQDAEEYLI